MKVYETSRRIMLTLKTVVVGPLTTNCYVVGCDETKKAAIIDPGAEPNRILQTVTENALKPEFIINTHGHIDHISANAAVKEKTGSPILIHKDDAWLLTPKNDNFNMFFPQSKPSPPPDRLLEEGDLIKFGKVALRVIHTPGHTPGGICLSYQKVLFTGDTLFAGGIGRSDLAGGSEKALMNSIRSKILAFDDGVTIYPGHGSSSTVGHERRYNPLL